MDVDREILVSDPRLEMSTSQPMTDMMEPIMALTDDAVEKIRCEKFNRTARDEFGKSVTYYLTCCDNLSDELEPHFIIYLQKVIYNLLKERKEFAYPALLLLYKAMSVMKMATYFSPNDGKMIPKINVACQHLSRVLLFMVYTMWTDMASRKQLIKNLQVLAKQNVKENPGFCYILTMDLCEAHHMFSLEPEKSSTLLGELCLLQARSALNGESWDLAMKHCKFAAETIYEYENREAFLIWAEALELKGNVSAAIEKAQLALKLSKNKDERQTVVTYLHKLQDGMVEQISSSDSDKLNESWLEGTNAKMDEEKAKSVQNNHVPKKKRSRPKRKRTDSSCSSSAVSQPMIVDSLTQIGDMSTWTSKRSRQISNSSNSSGFSTTITLPPQTQRPGPHFDDENIDRFLRDHNWDSSSDEDEVRTVSEPVNYADLEGSESDDEMDIDVGCEHLDQTWFEKGMSLDEKDVARFLYCYDVSIKRDAFYRDFFPQEDLQELLKSKPHGYKRCRIEMESAQKAICKVLGAAGAQNDIEIAGRSRCGQCFNNDEVVVEILFDPKENSSHRLPSEADSKPFGEVRGVLKSHFHRSSKYPILACTSNETDGWLMRPLCKSIPKIHVVNNKTKKESPHLTKNRIDIYELVGSKLNYKGKFDMNPVLRGQYVFIVVYLGWGKKHVYPLGAVLGVQQCGKDFNSSLKILEMQYKVPSLFPENTLVDQTYIFDASGREDRTDDLVVFTIDPPHSKDLDDALSIYKKDNNYVVGVHIADVASVVKKDDAVDKEARKRAVSFYIQNRRTHHMLPDRLSQDICSLVPDEKRPALSIFLMFNPDGKLVKEPIVKKTFIKSCRKLCYEEVQKIIENEGNSTVPSQLKSSIIDLHNLAQKIREKRLKDARFSVPFEDVRFCDMEEEGNCDEAHALVEEFMIQTNAAVAKFVKKRFPTCLPLRCQTSPATEEVQKWSKEENRIVDLLVHLQGKEVLPKMVISALEGIRKCVNEKTNFIPIQSDIWKRILDDLKSRDINQAGKMICTDEIHPLQNVAWIHWIKLLDTAEYRCSGVISDTKANHFSLDIQPYIHFTSPIRRYVDLVSHRLVHAILSGDACPYTVIDIQQICDDVNEATSRQKAFDRSCKVLAKTEKIGKSSMVFHAIVEAVTENGLELLLPGLRTVPSKCREIRFCLLNLNKKPEKKPDPKTNKDLVICQWKKRLYDTKGNKSQVTLNQQSELMVVEPNQHTVLVRYRDWADVLKGIFDKNLPVVQRITKRLDPAGDSELVPSFKGVDAVTSETEQGTIKSHQCRFSLSFKPGQVVKVQLGASPNNGLLLPQVELVHITKNLSLCHRHLDDPVGILSKYATHSVKQDFSSIEHYKKAWLPVLEMEAALSAASNEMTPIINNVNLTLSKTSISDKTVYTGTLQLLTSFCDERNIEFGGVPVERLEIDKRENTSDSSFIRGCGCNDYLCIRCFVPGATDNRIRDAENGMTWVGHAQVTSARRKKSKNDTVTNIGSNVDNDRVIVTFVLNDNSAPPPASLMLESKITGTVEIIYKLEVDRRTQNIFQKFGTTAESKNGENKLARAIALTRPLPEIPKHRIDMAEKMENDVLGNEDVPLPPNNEKQREAIQNALQKSFSLIQGPPGTGKTYTGIKLIYLFNEINAKVRAEGGQKCQVLFCGPSNKSVDMVAWYLLDRLGDACPNLIRMYGSSIVSQDYPVPNRDFSKRSMHDLKSDPRLLDITLHHIIRERGDYMEDIRMFDHLFALMLKKKKSSEDIKKINRFIQAVQLKQNDPKQFETDPDKASHKIIKKYVQLVNKAYTAELQKCDVILCTCSVGGNDKLVAATNIYQCIIDEAAMCPEPLAMVPIIATDAKQVVLIGDHKQLRPIIQCSEAAELGMEQSLFERYSENESVLTFLNTQYRMHPRICRFPSKQFYRGMLRTIFSRDDTIERLLPNDSVHVFCHVEGLEEMLTVSTEEGNEQSRSNMAEVDKVEQVYQWLIEKRASNHVTTRIPSKDIAVLSQYNSQVFAIKTRLEKYMDKTNSRNPEGPRLRKLNVSTVVSSQGGEWDYVIFSTVRSLPSYKIEPAPTLGWCRQNMGFITDANQINVALTRARKGLIIIGNMNLLKTDKVWKNLLDYYDRNECLVKDPKDFPTFWRKKRHRQPPQF